MKHALRLVLALMLGLGVGFGAAAQDAPKKKVAVYMTGKSIDESYKKVIGAKLVSAITQSGEYAAVERTADFLAALSAENDYQTSGEVRDSQIAALGQKFGVKYVAVADVSEVFGEFFIAARMINVETGLVEKAFDTNGAAESMAQLVALSNAVASGLISGLPSTSSTSSNSAGSAPQHLALCVMDRKGGIKYFTVEQWQNLSESAKLEYTKKGVCIIENGEAFLVGMRDLGSMDWNSAMSACTLPAKWQLSIMYSYNEPLNNALRAFGGEELAGWYWSNESKSSSYAWRVAMNDGYVTNSNKAVTYRVRAVAAVPGSSAK